MMKDLIPLMPFPYKIGKSLIHGFYPISSAISKLFPELEMNLREAGSNLDSKKYISGAIITSIIYLLFVGIILALWAFRTGSIEEFSTRISIILISLIISLFIFNYILLFPRWITSKKKDSLDEGLLFAVRHLMVQTTAGVPLFDAIFSVSEEYKQEKMNYGEISKEFAKIVKEVRSGTELTTALEKSATNNPSIYYRRVMWQLSNANKSGSDIGSVLKNMIEFLSDEQRIMIRKYGSQLNPLALFYMLMCIIGPTMGIVLIMVASTLVDLNVNEFIFPVILLFLLLMNVMFVGLIKSRRPKVAL